MRLVDLVLLLLVVLYIVATIITYHNPYLNVKVKIIGMFDYGNVGAIDRIELNITNCMNETLGLSIIVHDSPDYISGKKWGYVVIGAHTSKIINVTAWSPLLYITPYSLVWVQVFNGFNFANSEMVRAPYVPKPLILNNKFLIWGYDGKFNHTVPLFWGILLKPNTYLVEATKDGGVTVIGEAEFYQSVLVNNVNLTVSWKGEKVVYGIKNHFLFILVINATVYNVSIV